MSYFLKLTDLKQRRLSQLQKEEKIDECLLQSYYNCPGLMFEYLLKSREINRKYAKDLYSSSFFSYPEKIDKNLSIIDNLHSKYEINQWTICSRIPELLKELEDLRLYNNPI